MDALQAEFGRLCSRQDALHSVALDRIAALADILRAAASGSATPEHRTDNNDDNGIGSHSESLRDQTTTTHYEQLILSTLSTLPTGAATQRQQNAFDAESHTQDAMQDWQEEGLLQDHAQRATPCRRPRPLNQAEELVPQPEEQRPRRGPVPQHRNDPVAARLTLEESSQTQRPSQQAVRSLLHAAPDPMDGVELVALHPGQSPQPAAHALLAPLPSTGRDLEGEVFVAGPDVANTDPPLPHTDTVTDAADATVAESAVWAEGLEATALDTVMSQTVEEHLDLAVSSVGEHTSSQQAIAREAPHAVTDPPSNETASANPQATEDEMVGDIDESAAHHNALNITDALRSAAKCLQERINADWKEVGSSHVRMSKLVDESAGADLSSVVAPSVTLDRSYVNKAVADHLFRSALFSIAHEFSNAAHVKITTEDIQPFETLHILLDSLRNNERGPAIQWATENRSRLADCSRDEYSPLPTLTVDSDTNDPGSLTVTASMSSSSSPTSSPLEHPITDVRNANAGSSLLEFNLHRFDFLDLLENDKREEALLYARRFLSPFVDEFLEEVQELMACLLFAPDIASSPYAGLVTKGRHLDLERMLSSEYCRVMDMTIESPLLSVVRCGAKALPTLVKASVISSALRDRGSGTVLPVEVDLGRDYQYHTVFTCPVSREDGTDESNKPMILPCGHVLSKQSITRLPRGNQRFKCPYCPREQVQSECKPIQF